MSSRTTNSVSWFLLHASVVLIKPLACLEAFLLYRLLPFISLPNCISNRKLSTLASSIIPLASLFSLSKLSQNRHTHKNFIYTLILIGPFFKCDTEGWSIVRMPNIIHYWWAVLLALQPIIRGY